MAWRSIGDLKTQGAAASALALRVRRDDGNDIVTFRTHDGAGAELATGARVQLLPDFTRSLWFDAAGSTLTGSAA